MKTLLNKKNELQDLLLQKYANNLFQVCSVKPYDLCLLENCNDWVQNIFIVHAVLHVCPWFFGWTIMNIILVSETNYMVVSFYKEFWRTSSKKNFKSKIQLRNWWWKNISKLDVHLREMNNFGHCLNFIA